MSINWWTEIVRLLVTVLLSGLGVGGYIKYRYTKKLNKESEHLKHDLQKAAFNAELLIAERHRIYSELAEKVIIAQGSVVDYYDIPFGTSRELTYEEYEEDDFHKLFNELKVKTGIQKEFFRRFKESREDGIEWWRKTKHRLIGVDAERELAEAKNYYLIKNIYLIDAVDEEAWDAIESMYDFYRHTDACIKQRNRSRGLSSDDELALDANNKKASEAVSLFLNNLKKHVAEPIA